jgi:ATP-dependent Clp protease ATP-binding subunit ClpC
MAPYTTEESRVPKKSLSEDELLEQQLAGIRKALAEEKLDDAHILLKRLPRGAKKRADACRMWGDYLMARRKAFEAADWYEAAMGLEPQEANNYLLLAEALMQAQRAPQGMAILESGIQRAADPLPIYDRLELVYNHFGVAPAKVTAMIDDLLQRYAGRPEALYKKGEAAHAVQLWPTAIDFFRRCIDAGYVGPRQHHLLAQALAQTGHRDGALYFFRKALQDPKANAFTFVDARDYLVKGALSGDEKVIAALTWVTANKVRDMQSMTQHRFLELSEKELKSRYDEWLAEIDPTLDYVHLAEFFKNLVFFKKDHESYNFDAASSFKSCIDKLADGDHELEHQYFRAWMAHHTGRHEIARSLFAAVAGTAEASPWMLDGVEEARKLLPQERPLSPGTPPGANMATVLSTRLKGEKNSQVWGADTLTDRILELLAQDGRRSLVLVGPSAVGKSAAIRHLAWRLAHNRCPGALKNFRLLQTSTSAVLSGARYIGMWQERLLDLCEQGAFSRRTIVYWEDLINLATAGQVSEDRARFLDVLVPRLERREIVLVGEMLPQQVRRLFGQEPQLARLFLQIDVSEPAADEVVDILRHYVDHRVKGADMTVSPAAVQEAITLTQVFMPYKALPGKALDLLGTALDDALTAGDAGDRKLDADGVMETFCRRTGVPRIIVSQGERLERAAVRAFFEERILGQSAAVDSLIDAVTMFKSRLSDPDRPIRSFLFVGPTGVGKTEAARVLAQYLFGSPDRMLRLNMSEYSGPDGVAKLIGSSYRWGGQTSAFLEQVRTRPFCVVLLDEIEKADGAVLNLLLQLLDTGQLSDAEGRAAYFQSSIIIMTSNIGARRYTTQAIGFGDGAPSDVKGAVLDDVKEFFSPEVFNRFDVKIAFDPLPRPILETLANREIGKVLTRRGIIERNLVVEVDPQVVEHILKTGYDPKYGARHLRRAVEAAVAVPLAVALSEAPPVPDEIVRINMRKGSPRADRVHRALAELDSLRELAPAPEVSLAGVSDRELARLLESAHDKVQALKARLDFAALTAEYEHLQAEMARPSFWDDARSARDRLQRYAEVNRTMERVHRWERTLEQIGTRIPTAYERSSPNMPKWRRGRLEGLLKDLQSAELEALLENKEDTADAFVLVRSAGSDAHHRDWLLDVVGVYTRWAGRRGYRAEICAEQPDAEAGFAIMMHVSGMNAYGLLKNEQGIHRLLLKSGTADGRGKKRRTAANCDCYVRVLADVQPSGDREVPVSLRSTGLKPQRRGWKLKLLSRRVTLSHAATGESVQLYTDRKTDADMRILVDFFKSYLVQSSAGAAARETDDGEWGSIVRTLDTGARSCVRDHKTGMVIRRTQDYLAGKIDALLLERLL